MDLFNGLFMIYWIKELLLHNPMEVFSKIFTGSGKMHHVGINSGTSKSFYTFEDIYTLLQNKRRRWFRAPPLPPLFI